MAHKYMPRGFVEVSANHFLQNPEEYCFEGAWIEKKLPFNSFIAYTDAETVKLDLDSTSFMKVKEWARASLGGMIFYIIRGE